MLSTTLRISSIIDAEIAKLSANFLNIVLAGFNQGAALGYLTLIQQFAQFRRLGGCFFGNGFLPLSSWISNRFLGRGRTSTDGKWRMPVLVKIGDAGMEESVSWVELTFANALQRFTTSFGTHPLLNMPLCVVSSNSEEASQTIAAAILLEDHVGFRSVHFKAYKGQKDVMPCITGSAEHESFIVFLAKAEQWSDGCRPRLAGCYGTR